jgi:CheY-like chemotaxis protein
VEIPPGPYIQISVTDTGYGMDEATRVRVFEPFFTTKKQGRGTGLGLSTAYGIVKQSNGFIWITSEVQKGTTFWIHLPRVEGKRKPRSTQTRPAPEPGSETVLLVEDEPLVRRAASRILARSGYTVLEAGDPSEAIRICKENPEPIHVLLTDLVMPQMNGLDLARLLREIRSDLRVVFMSGYSEQTAMDDNLLQDGGVFLQKPFSPEALMQKIRETLARGHAPGTH